VRVSFYEVLDRVGFDPDPVRGQVGTDRETLAQAGFVPNRQLLFSPFQQLDARPLSEAFHEFTPGVRTLQSAIVSATAEAREPTISRIVLRESGALSARLSGTEQAHNILQTALEESGNVVAGYLRRFAEAWRNPSSRLPADSGVKPPRVAR